MPGGYKKIKPSDNPKPFKPGNQYSGNGGKKLLSNLGKEKGYTGNEIRKVFSIILAMTASQRKEYLEKHDPDGLEALACKAVNKAVKTGMYRYVKDIIEHVAGKPKEIHDVKVETKRELENAPYETIYPIRS